MQKTTELTAPPEVGKYYLVPCIATRSKVLFWCDRTIPLLGNLHEDREIIGFQDLHWHIDFRFLSLQEFGLASCNGRVLVQRYVLSQKNTAGDIVWERRRCQRRMPEFPTHYWSEYGLTRRENPVNWLKTLEEVYQQESACSSDETGPRVCPHRNFDLSSIPADEQGSKVCPLHGLQWDAQGKLCPRLHRACAIASPTEKSDSSIVPR